MRAVIYCRVSTVEQTQNLSLPTQEEACRAYCAHHGYTVEQLFVDAGESAKTVERPEFLRMLAYCRTRSHAVRAVVVYSLTRFSRNSADHHSIAGLLRGHGVSLRSVTEPIDDTPSGKLMEGILAAMAQFDNDQRAERTKAGLRAAVTRGRWVWTAPLGYLTGVRQGSPSLVLDPERAPLVRLAFEMIADGRLTGRALQQHLHARGLRSRSGKAVSHTRLYEIVRGVVYTGRIESASGTAVGDFEPLITPEIFAAVQRRLDTKGTAIAAAHRHVNHPDFPLRRFVQCARCGRALTGAWSKGRSRRYAFYRCPKKNCLSVTRDRLHDAFLTLLDACAPTPGMLRVLHERILDVWGRERATGQQGLRHAQQQVQTLAERVRKLDELFIAERIDDATYRPRRDELREQLALARLTVNELQISDVDIEGHLAFAEYALRHMSAIWTDAATPTARARVQATFFPEGLRYDPQRGFIEPRNPLALFQLGGTATTQSEMVDHVGPTWNQITAWLCRLQQLKTAA